MSVELEVSGIGSTGRVFLTWAPVRAELRLAGEHLGSSLDVTLRNAGRVGRLLFNTRRDQNGTPTLDLTVPADGSPVAFWLAGEFMQPSNDYGDAAVEIVDQTTSAVLGSADMMVRIRKDALALSQGERDRLLSAFGTLNGRGTGNFKNFRDMHVAASRPEAHGNMGFLPWHRAYLLDLERELQAIDDTVALPYWRFDEPAAALYKSDFLGEDVAGRPVRFDPGHPLEFWTTDGVIGFARGLRFPIAQAPPLRNEATTLALGSPASLYADFIDMEGDPHGDAHTSFSGPVNSVPTAARDPLFFLLHANVDRLWSKWQWLHGRSDSAQSASFAPASPNRIGHRLGDTMWPWNNDTQPPRPATAPGGAFPPGDMMSAPGGTPKVEQMLDFQGVLGGDDLGFAYDDVPFEVPPTAVATV